MYPSFYIIFYIKPNVHRNSRILKALHTRKSRLFIVGLTLLTAIKKHHKNRHTIVLSFYNLADDRNQIDVDNRFVCSKEFVMICSKFIFDANF